VLIEERLPAHGHQASLDLLGPLVDAGHVANPAAPLVLLRSITAVRLALA